MRLDRGATEAFLCNALCVCEGTNHPGRQGPMLLGIEILVGFECLAQDFVDLRTRESDAAHDIVQEFQICAQGHDQMFTTDPIHLRFCCDAGGCGHHVNGVVTE